MGNNTRAHVIVVSSSAAAGTASDTTGPVLVAWLASLGFEVTGPEVVADGPDTRTALQAATRQRLCGDGQGSDGQGSDGYAVVVTTGGTGLTADDQTPEITAALLDRRVPGIEHALMRAGLVHTPTAALSRGVAGVVGSTLVVNLPGSAGAVRDATEVLAPILPHALDQIGGVRTHVRGEASATKPTKLQVLEASITDAPLATDAAARVRTDESGAVVEFAGVIRNHDSGRTGITGLSYTCHPDAEAMLEAVVGETSAAFPGTRVFCQHRVGELAVGDVAIVVAVAAAHRGQAFACCEAVVDAVKARVPIWKEQHYSDGSHDWVGIQ